MDGDFCQRIGGKSVGEMAVNFATRAPLTPKTIPFWDEFVKRTKRQPVYTAFGANDAVYIYAQAVERAKTTEAGAVIKELEKTNYVGIPGTTQFDETHDVKPGTATYRGPALIFAQWRDKCSREVVYPKTMRTAEFVYPSWIKK
jgi:branched-chain amino acid transport system substrate-binding protein